LPTEAEISAGTGTPNLVVPFGSLHMGDGNPVVVIAEIGINHEGSVDRCAWMIEAAVRAGADVVKLQTSDPDEHYLPGTPSYELYSSARFTGEETAAMFALAKRLGVEICTTCGDVPTFEVIEALEPAGHKISSGMLVNLPMIRRFARSGRPLIVSTGMADVETVAIAIDAAREAGARHLALLQCTSLYPAPPATLNLRAMATLRDRFGAPVGFSDHSSGIEAATLAVAAGACVIEKHFTFDRSRESFDHGVSLEPAEFAAMVTAIRAAEVMLGDGIKTMCGTERDHARKWSRRLVARRDISAGQAIAEEDLSIKRTAMGEVGLAALCFDETIGKTAKRPLPKFTVISLDDVGE